MTYTKIPKNTFEELQLNAGILLTEFDPSTGTVTEENIIGATDGGVSFTATPTYRDNADGIDNAVLNTKELKVLESWEVKMSGTMKTLDTSVAKLVIGACDSTTADSVDKILARQDLKTADFTSIWWVGDYGSEGGFVAIKLINALSSNGFSLQSANKDKGSFSFEFTGHSSIESPDTVPFEIYIKSKAEAT